MQPIKEMVTQRKDILKAILEGTNLSMAVVQVGHNAASDRYVRNKLQDCAEVGIRTQLIKYSEDISEAELLLKLEELNSDLRLTGYLVQLPLPAHISEQKVKLAISPTKDLDGFHPLSLTTPATPLGIYNYLCSNNYDFVGKNAVIIGRSNIVGRPMAKLLLNNSMNVTIIHSKTSEVDRRYFLANADLIIVAAGKAEVLNSSYELKDSAVVIDVGINFNSEGKLIGDCEPNLPVAFQSPVPGGVGLLTRLAVIDNLITLSAQ